jgi:hypothetical protein
MAHLIFLQPSLFLAAAFQFVSRVKLRRLSKQHPPPPSTSRCPTGLLRPKHPPVTFMGIGETSLLATWPAHCSLFRRKNVSLTVTLNTLPFAVFHMISRQEGITCRGIKCFVFVMRAKCFFCKVGAEFVNVNYLVSIQDPSGLYLY